MAGETVTYPTWSIGSAEITDDSIMNADVNSSADIAKSKLASLGIVNADVDASAAIAKSKLASLGIVNADVDASAAIALSKLASTPLGTITTGYGNVAVNSTIGDVLSVTTTGDAIFIVIAGLHSIGGDSGNKTISWTDDSNNAINWDGGMEVDSVGGDSPLGNGTNSFVITTAVAWSIFFEEDTTGGVTRKVRGVTTNPDTATCQAYVLALEKV